MEDGAIRVARRVTLDSTGLATASPSQDILIADGACDQHLLTRTWRILRHTGRSIIMQGAFAGRNQGETFPVVTAAAKLIDERGQAFAAVAHEALLDLNPLQRESLLALHQSLSRLDIGIDDRARSERDIHGEPGNQMSRFQGHSAHFFFDGAKCFYRIEPISDSDLSSLPRVELSDGSVAYEPHCRLHTARHVSVPVPSQTPWKYRLGFIPDHVVQKTLACTTQMVPTVEAETREIMRDHFQTRLPELRLRRVNDTCYVDTFFSSVKSVRGYTCWTQYSFAKSGLDAVYLMRRRSQGPSTLPELITEYGAPNVMKSDNAPEFHGKRWVNCLRQNQITSAFTEPHHPNQNLCERRGGANKAMLTHLLAVTKFEIDFWCFGLEYVNLLRTVLARRSLGWRSAHECHFGDTPDISVFRFVFWATIWYYTPARGFPKTKMLPGRFLGIATTTGDAFCFLVLTEPEDDSPRQVLSRSVVRKRYAQQEHPVVECSDSILKIYKSDGVTLLPDPDLDSLDPLDDLVRQHLDTVGDDSTIEDTNDPLADAIAEVYGPPAKRPRIENPSLSLVDLPVAEEPAVTVPAVPAAEEPPPSQLLTHSQQNSTLPSVSLDQAPSVETVVGPVATGTPFGDDQMDDHSDPPRPPVPVTQDDDVEPSLSDELNRQLEVDSNDTDDDLFDGIIGHSWDNGSLLLEVHWVTDETSTMPYSLVKRDYPLACADYILKHKVGTADGAYSTGRYCRWARTFKRQFNRTVRRVLRLSGMYTLSPEDVGTEEQIVIPTNLSSGVPERIIRRTSRISAQPGTPRITQKKKSKPGRLRRPVQVQYGIKIPQCVEDAYALDDINGNALWRDAIAKEIASLLSLGCFDFKAPDYKPSPEYQYAPLRMIFEIKHDGRHKARLVAGGHVVDARGISSRSTVVKGISVRLLDLIAHRDNLEILTGDIGNAFITSPCLEKIYSRAGPEWGDKQDAIMIFVKALYGLRSSSRAFRSFFAESLRSMGFVACRYDRDVWMRMRETDDGYDYICTHVDDFKIVARDAKRWSTRISDQFLLKSLEAPKYYLGNDYNFSEDENAWVVGCQTYIKECIRRIEDGDTFDGTLYPHRTPLPPECHPELDDSELLDDRGTKAYQMLIGMAQWAVTIGRLDIAFSTSSLSRFSTAPRLGHLELALYMFGYLKKFPNRRIVMDSRPLQIDSELLKDSFHPDFLEDYPEAAADGEEIPQDIPAPRGSEMDTAIFHDTDHAHDQVTRRSITGIIVFVGSTPVLWPSKRQGCIATSTYCAEFVGMRSAVEEAISLRYMLRCLGCTVTKPTNLFGDNFGVVQSATIPDSDLKKKHVAISYHFVRDAIARKIINAIWCRTYENFADICTKSLGGNEHHDIVNDLMC